MAVFAVTYTHTDMNGWNTHLHRHLEYLSDLITEGNLLASGPQIGTPETSALLIVTAPTRNAALELIERDPYSQHAIIDTVTIVEWDPIFGAFQPFSGHTTAGH